MVSATSLLAVAVVATSIGHVQGHGYMEKPLAEFKEGTESPSAWVVELQPQWKGDWDKAKGDEGMVALYKQLKKSNNVKDIRTMIDGDPKLYGEDCGNTDPKAKAKDPPTTGDATFSRGIVHAGPCEIWLDDEMVLQNDDCQSAYGDGTKATISVFKPIDYSSCKAGGCMFRYYWLALQRRDSKTLWQVYKNCIPLTGPAGGGGGASNTTTSGSSTQQTSPSSGESDTPSSGTSDSPSSGTSDSPSSGESESPSSGTSDSPSSGTSDSPSSGTSDSPSSGESDSPSSGTSDSPSSGESDTPSTESTPAPETPSVETPETPPASDGGKCSVRRRRRN